MADRALDAALMARAIRLAWRGQYSAHPNPRVGCVLAHGEQVVGEGWHERAGEAHAEVRALADAGERARDATAYVTLEPCRHHGRTPPCADALVEAGVGRVVVAMTDPNPQVAGGGIERLEAAGIPVTCGVLDVEARRLNDGFVTRMTTGRPRVRVKVAASLDGRTAMASGESQWVTGAAARSDVQRLRAMSGAIITGAGTVLADDPSLTVRPEQADFPAWASQPPGQPLRVILDRQFRTPSDAQVITTGPVLIVGDHTQESSDAARRLQDSGAQVLGVDTRHASGMLAAVLAELGRRDVNDVLVEAGPTVAGAFVEVAQVDEFWLYQAPVFLGSQGRPVVELPIERMADKVSWTVLDRRQVGADQRLILTPRQHNEL
ncbi:diaminohydroxyphosphoribosylaminopyrimidine deaminase [Tamilnaduibacter salinus]|uniref:Riboflavin biosynthesis protein RibD n=1 Tax=Tamilnaduibacter salinus TaxID=1484056 RepID=A0A2U1CUF4_9GAMM|nr:bifunctional diaminohydroxyphosphoribosylaminopyrimidine deaminase/5-amino-6-(5-phosphoribosylamino)uracil reductase RibD [Tamilnaduibacter salinus]PVY70393.1 diaminohydroxyphosphoribosylaminopyrimidine deaminase [Tamilnaduibacter salinus]